MGRHGKRLGADFVVALFGEIPESGFHTPRFQLILATNIDFNMAHLVLLLTLWYILKFRVFNLGFLPFDFEARAKSQESP